MASPAKRLLILWLACVVVTAHASALPVHIGFAFVDPDTPAMTHGCDRETCCTALCYVDKEGTHHCIHGPTESCACGISEDYRHGQSLRLSTLGILQEAERNVPTLLTFDVLSPALSFIRARSNSVPTPPPRQDLRDSSL